MSSTGKIRKRPPTEVDSSLQKSARRNDPLRDVVACLTGLTHSKKIQFHEIIESLGGRYDLFVETVAVNRVAPLIFHVSVSGIHANLTWTRTHI
jgi:hypothetical protein